MAASGGVPDERDVLAFFRHAGGQFVHQMGPESEVVECLDVDVGVYLITRLVRDHLDPSGSSLL